MEQEGGEEESGGVMEGSQMTSSQGKLSVGLVQMEARGHRGHPGGHFCTLQGSVLDGDYCGPTTPEEVDESRDAVTFHPSHVL